MVSVDEVVDLVKVEGLKVEGLKVRMRMWTTVVNSVEDPWSGEIVEVVDKVKRVYEVHFKKIESMEVLRLWLRSVAVECIVDRDIQKAEQEFEEDSVGITRAGLNRVYKEEVMGRVRSKGGNEATGSRKTSRECKGKARFDELGDWDMNL